MAPDARPADLFVIAATRPWTCAECSTEFDRGSFLAMEDAGPVCTVCSDLVHLEFLPRGDTALTLRARRQSRLSAVVVRWSRSRRRYERQGILAETDAIEQAERECLADAAARERRRQREVLRRAEQDERFIADLTEAIRAWFPGCPADRAARIARHAGDRSSGRIGRTRAGRALDPEAVRLAVAAAIRHEDTPYDELLMSGHVRSDARELVRQDVARVLDGWRAGPVS